MPFRPGRLILKAERPKEIVDCARENTLPGLELYHGLAGVQADFEKACYFSFSPVVFFYKFLTFPILFLSVSEPPPCSYLMRIQWFAHVFPVAKKSWFSSLLASQNEAIITKRSVFLPPGSMIFSVSSLYAFIAKWCFASTRAPLLKKGVASGKHPDFCILIFSSIASWEAPDLTF